MSDLTTKIEPGGQEPSLSSDGWSPRLRPENQKASHSRLGPLALGGATGSS